MRVLVIENDPELSRQIQSQMRDHSYSVDRAEQAREGLTLALAGVYDLMVFGRTLPDVDGLELLRQVRAAGVTSPVIVLSDRTEVDDRICGFDAGADDYLVKPISIRELLSRTQAMLRRCARREPNMMQVGDLRVDPLTHAVARGAAEIKLTAREFALLQYLMQHAGHVVTRRQIVENVWNRPEREVTNVVEVQMKRLRKKIDGDSSHPLIRTLRGVGYVIRTM